MARQGTPPTPPRRERTCIACGAKESKTALLRIVRGTDGVVSFDPGGRMSGRGAYVCSADCFDRARGSRLNRALRTEVSDGDCERIAQDLRAFSSSGEESFKE